MRCAQGLVSFNYAPHLAAAISRKLFPRARARVDHAGKVELLCAFKTFFISIDIFYIAEVEDRYLLVPESYCFVGIFRHILCKRKVNGISKFGRIRISRSVDLRCKRGQRVKRTAPKPI